jgi:hypothetical protein
MRDEINLLCGINYVNGNSPALPSSSPLVSSPFPLTLLRYAYQPTYPVGESCQKRQPPKAQPARNRSGKRTVGNRLTLERGLIYLRFYWIC